MAASLRLTTDHTFHTWPWPRTLNDVLFHLRMSSHLMMTTDISWWLPLLTSYCPAFHIWLLPHMNPSDEFLWWLPLMTFVDVFLCLHLLSLSTVFICCLPLQTSTADLYCCLYLMTSPWLLPLMTPSAEFLCGLPMLISSSAFQWWPPLMTSFY